MLDLEVKWTEIVKPTMHKVTCNKPVMDGEDRGAQWVDIKILCKKVLFVKKKVFQNLIKVPDNYEDANIILVLLFGIILVAK